MIDHKLIRRAIEEDLPFGDATQPLVRAQNIECAIAARSDALVCGTEYVRETFEQVAKQMAASVAEIEFIVPDGNVVRNGDTVMRIRGLNHLIFAAERVSLNFLMRMSGIATYCNTIVKQAPENIVLLDTRKTTPGWRIAEKYAFRTGGIVNHRLSLSEAIMLKDNHRPYLLAPSVRGPISALEIEVDTIEQIAAALAYHPQAILLDNFTQKMLEEAMNIVPAEIKLEISGNVDLATLDTSRFTRPVYVSLGRLLQSFAWIDFGLDLV